MNCSECVYRLSCVILGQWAEPQGILNSIRGKLPHTPQQYEWCHRYWEAVHKINKCNEQLRQQNKIDYPNGFRMKEPC